jgi:DUF2075 family protein
MIVYSSTKEGFLNDVLTGSIETNISESLVREAGYSVGKSEKNSWQNSMQFMSMIMYDKNIPSDTGIAIEYKIPKTSKRIDFIITGKDESNNNSAIIIELKQWSEGIHITDMDGILNTDFFGNVSHPSYQAWSYKTILEDYNENVRLKNIKLSPCAYLHNYSEDDIVSNQFYKGYLEKAPIFYKNDAIKLQEFINKYIKYGDNKETLYYIDNGKIKPSKNLAESLASMVSGNKEFVLIDDQKVVFETSIQLAKQSNEGNKHVLIVEGGPGTGKSVVAINLMSELTKMGYIAPYVTHNSAPREVYKIKLTGTLTQNRFSNLFMSSGSFYDSEKNEFDTLIVDEAHRLTERSGLFSNKGEHQVKEIINASKFSIFFLDEDQRVTIKDIGSKEVIIRWAKYLNVPVQILKLESQFRCNGSDGYLSWLDDILQIRNTANDDLEGINYDFRVFDDPSEVHQKIIEQNKTNNKSRVVAGYCWNWISKNNPILNDIIIGNYKATWNLNSQGQSWIIKENSVEQVGCIHTCQGLELDYVGVILGPDLVVRNGHIITDATKRAKTDQSLKGWKSIYKSNPNLALELADKIIKNTYRTLMTRGMKGCYIYSVDRETRDYFRNKLEDIARNNLLRKTDTNGATIILDE